MEPTLLEDLASKPAREVAGADSAARFDYQRDWALSRMFDFHLAEKDYLVAFEFHDDVVFFNSEDAPDAVDFFQVKTQKKSTTRRLQSFLQKKKNSNSVLGKLLCNLDGICKGYTIKLVIVSNIPYEFSNADICADDLKKEDKQKILTAIKNEFPEIDQEILSKLHFYVSNVPLDGFPIHLQGQASEIFRLKFGEDAGYNVHSWIRLIQGEIKRKNSFPPDKIDTVEDLKSKKCLGKSFLNSTLDDVQERHRSLPDMGVVKSELQQCGWRVPDVLRLDKVFPSAVTDFQDPSNTECVAVLSKINELLVELNLEDCKVADVLEHVHVNLKKDQAVPSIYKERVFLSCLTLLAYYEKL